MIDTHKIREFLAQRSGHSPWRVFETNAFGYVDREKHVQLRGRVENPADADGLVELLNGAAELLREWDDLEVTRRGIGTRTNVQILKTEFDKVRAALTETLQWKDANDPRVLELKKLL